MRRRTIASLSVVLLVTAGLVVAGVALDRETGTDMTVTWVSDTGRAVGGNHHAPAAGRVNGTGIVYAPVSGRSGSGDCALVALAGSDGSERWAHPIPPANCTIHSVADPALADVDDDGIREVIAATTEGTVTAFHPTGGDAEFRANLTSYGYTKPVVADLVGEERREILVVDARGTVSVFRPDGEQAWSRQFGTYTWGQPAVADLDGDGDPEIAVGLGGAGELRTFEANGSRAWKRPRSVAGSITWMTTGRLDDDAAIEVVVATTEGVVAAFDGATGEREWTREFGSAAAVRAVGDGDGRPKVYAVAGDGTLRSLFGGSGETEWETTLTAGDVQMMPPPVLGDLDGDDDRELLAVTNDGIVSVVDPESGAVRATYEREASIFSRPTLADVDGDGDAEGFVMYGDGRVVAFDFGG